MWNFSKDLKEKRRKRAIDMMNKIHDIYGLKIDLDSLLLGEVITRANMLNNIAKCNNLTREEAQKYISNDSLAYIPSTKMSTEDGVKLARSANCVVIFAHPCLIKNQEYVEEILKFGFDGMEVRYPSKKNDEKHFRELAKKWNVLVSAGSDCHRGEEKDGDHADIGTSTLDLDEFMPIAKLLNFEI